MAPTPEETRKHLRLPSAPLHRALDVARAIEESAVGELSREVVAGQLRVKPGTGGFTRRISASIYFGLVEGRDALSVTPLGRRALSEGSEGIAARRQAVLGSSFGPLLERLKGRPARREAVALLIRERLGTPTSTADDASRALMSSCADAGLISAEGVFDAAAIEGLSLGAGVGAGPREVPPTLLAEGLGPEQPLPAPAAPAAPVVAPASSPGASEARLDAATVTAPSLGRIELEIRLAPEVMELLRRLVDGLSPAGRARTPV